MGRTAGQFCSREFMNSLQAVPLPPAPAPVVDVSTERKSDAMTWQQQEKFGTKANGHKFNRFRRGQKVDLDAVPDLPVVPVIGDSRPWDEEQAAFPVQASTAPRKTRGKVAATSLLNNSTLPTAVQHLSPHLTNVNMNGNGPQMSPKNNKNSPQQNKGKSVADSKSDALSKRAYVPPHLRKPAAPNNATVDRQPDAAITTSGISITSKGYKAKSAAKSHAASNGVHHVVNLPISPPATLPEPDKPDADNEEVGKDEGETRLAWDTPVLDTTAAPTKRENPRWPRGPKPPVKKTIWPKQSEMRAMPTNSSSDGGVSFKSNSNGDPDYDVKKLMDWNGDWLPPPEQWSARRSHSSRQPFGQAIEQWMNGHDEQCLDPIDTASLSFTEDGPCREIVPKYWIMEKIEGKSTGEFWKEMPVRAPSPLSDCNLVTDLPFWDRYGDCSKEFLEALEVPEARVDPNDPENYTAGPNSLCSAIERIESIQKGRQHAQNRAVAKQRRPLREPSNPLPPVEDRRIRPTSNVYFRPVQPADVRGIAEIYNHYVELTIFANEYDGRTESQIASRINDIVTAGLPYLVAVARGNQPKGPQGYVSEKIVGFISLDDYCDQSSMYRYTFELELYVHPGYVSQNIAKCLLDRILEMANTGYNARGGYEYRNDFEYLKTGPSRVIKTIMLTVYKEHGEDSKQIEKYLEDFKFRRAGHVPLMGYKLDKAVDVFYFRHTTTEDINPAVPPTVPLERK